MDDLKTEDYQLEEDGEMNKFIVNELIDFMGGVLFEASILLAVDKSIDYEGFHPFLPSQN